MWTGLDTGREVRHVAKHAIKQSRDMVVVQVVADVAPVAIP